jgi:formamidopyrimidine-DNA glycosylase
VLPGKVIKSVQVLREKSFINEVNPSTSSGHRQLIGLTVNQVTRKAKQIIIKFKDSDVILLIHLKMTGQLIYIKDDPPSLKLRKGTAGQLIFDQKSQITNHKLQIKSKYGVSNSRIVGGHPTEDWVKKLPSKHTRVIVRYSDGATLYFNDMRVFGWMKLVDRGQWVVDSKKYPPDVIDPEYTTDYLKKVLKRSNRSVKLVLLDQNKVGGLGNIYINDALWLSGTKPTRSAHSLKNAEIGRLHTATIKVIKRGIETGGASQSTYKHINGLGGKYQEEFLVYKREGEVCGKNGCPGVIKKIKLGGRGTYYCPMCQI